MAPLPRLRRGAGRLHMVSGDINQKKIEGDNLVIMVTFPQLDDRAVMISASRVIDSRGEIAAYQTRSISKVAGQGTMIKLTVPIYEVTS